MTTLISTLTESVRYRGREGQWAFNFHRLSGLSVLLFLALHILDTATVYFVPQLYEHAINLYRSTAFMLGEIALVAAVVYHGLNGYKIIYFDSNPARWNLRADRRWFWGIVIASFLLWLPAAYFMGRALYLNNICRCPTEDGGPTIPAWANYAILLALAAAVVIALRIASLRSPAGGVGRNFETWMWLFMRWSGVLLVPLAWIHVLINDVLVSVHRIDLDYVAMRWASLGWRAYDIALLAFAFAHGVNGLRYVTDDHIHDPRWQKAAHWALLLTWIGLTAIGAAAAIGGVRRATGV